MKKRRLSRLILIGQFLAGAVLAQAPSRETVTLADGRHLDGVRIGQGMEDRQLRTDDGRIHLLRRVSGEKEGGVWREVTSSVNWPSFNGDNGGNRYTTMTQITKTNVATLAPKWIFNMHGITMSQTTPQVVDGIMYVTNLNECYALDAGTGRQLWHWSAARTPGIVTGGANRGAAIAGDRIYVMTDTAHLLSFNRFTGDKLFDTEVADIDQSYSSTGAPLAVGNLIVAGVTGGESGARGFLAAYDQITGREIWRFWTVPAPGDPEAATWRGKDMAHGGAPTWMTGTYDAQLDTVYWTTGNPSKEFDGSDRLGDNLYSDSVVALDAASGRLKWYYQFTPHDLYDYDATQTPVLIDAEFEGRPRKLLVQANRNGFFYVLDRITGKLLLGKAFVHNLTWAKGIGSDGRPILNENQIPVAQGTHVCPSALGATNYFAPSYSPSTGYFYVQAFERCGMIATQDQGEWIARRNYVGGRQRAAPNEESRQYLRAINVSTGDIAWELEETPGISGWGGTLATATGIVFFCEQGGAFAAADAATGKLLWSFQANVLWKSSPMAYMFDGKEYLATVAAGDIIAYALPDRR